MGVVCYSSDMRYLMHSLQWLNRNPIYLLERKTLCARKPPSKQRSAARALLIGLFVAVYSLLLYRLEESPLYSPRLILVAVGLWLAVRLYAMARTLIVAGTRTAQVTHDPATWDMLVLTPLTGRQVVLGKWWAAVRHTLPLHLWAAVLGLILSTTLAIFQAEGNPASPFFRNLDISNTRLYFYRLTALRLCLSIGVIGCMAVLEAALCAAIGTLAAFIARKQYLVLAFGMRLVLLGAGLVMWLWANSLPYPDINGSWNKEWLDYNDFFTTMTHTAFSTASLTDGGIVMAANALRLRQPAPLFAVLRLVAHAAFGCLLFITLIGAALSASLQRAKRRAALAVPQPAVWKVWLRQMRPHMVQVQAALWRDYRRWRYLFGLGVLIGIGVFTAAQPFLVPLTRLRDERLAPMALTFYGLYGLASLRTLHITLRQMRQHGDSVPLPALGWAVWRWCAPLQVLVSLLLFGLSLGAAQLFHSPQIGIYESHRVSATFGFPVRIREFYASPSPFIYLSWGDFSPAIAQLGMAIALFTLVGLAETALMVGLGLFAARLPVRRFAVPLRVLVGLGLRFGLIVFVQHSFIMLSQGIPVGQQGERRLVESLQVMSNVSANGGTLAVANILRMRTDIGSTSYYYQVGFRPLFYMRAVVNGFGGILVLLLWAGLAYWLAHWLRRRPST